MKNLSTLKKIVFEILTENVKARCSDTILIMEVFYRLHIDLSQPYSTLALTGQLRQLENGAITRARRKCLEEHPELKVEKITTLRNNEQQKYKDFSKVSSL